MHWPVPTKQVRDTWDTSHKSPLNLSCSRHCSRKRKNLHQIGRHEGLLPVPTGRREPTTNNIHHTFRSIQILTSTLRSLFNCQALQPSNGWSLRRAHRIPTHSRQRRYLRQHRATRNVRQFLQQCEEKHITLNINKWQYAQRSTLQVSSHLIRGTKSTHPLLMSYPNFQHQAAALISTL